MMSICIISSMFCVFERWPTARQAGGPIMLQLSDVLVSDESMLVLGYVSASVNVCVGGELGGLEAYSGSPLSICYC